MTEDETFRALIDAEIEAVAAGDDDRDARRHLFADLVFWRRLACPDAPVEVLEAGLHARIMSGIVERYRERQQARDLPVTVWDTIAVVGAANDAIERAGGFGAG